MTREIERQTGGRLVVLFLVVVSTLACVSWPGKRTPRLGRPRILPTVEDPVAIRLLVDDRSARPKKVASALERSRKKFPYLALAVEEVADPDYTLELSVAYRASQSKLNGLSGHTFLLIPARFTEEVTVEAMVTDSEERTLGVFRSTGRRKIVMQMHLLWVAPVAMPLMPHVERKMWTNTFRDVFLQAGEAIAAEQRRTGQRDTAVATSPSREDGSRSD